MTPAGTFRGGLAAGELLCLLVIPCSTTMPEALVVLAGFGSQVSSFFVLYSCNLNMNSVTTRTVKNECAAHQEGIETLWVGEAESMK